MTPRDKLIENIVDIVYAHDGNMGNIIKLIESTLKTHYAIGKWVPVSKRLPEFGRSNLWAGTFKTHKGRVMTDKCHKDWFRTDCVTHWLELDMPEVES